MSERERRSMVTLPPWRDAPFKDLQTRGFVLVPSFLSPAELEICREEFGPTAGQ